MASSENEKMDQKYHDDIVRRRLINDGDAMGDDRKLNSLAKAYVIMEEGEENEESVAAQLRSFIQSIKHAEFLAKRTVQAIKVNEEAKQTYIDLKAQVQSEILGAQYFIDKSKEVLEEDAKNRKYGGRIDALTKMVKSKPDRKLTEIKCRELAPELEAMKKRQAWIQDQLDNRKRAVSMLSGAVEVVKDLVRESSGDEVPGPPVAVIPMDVDSTELLKHQDEDVKGGGAVVEPIDMVTNSGAVATAVMAPSGAPEGDKSNSEKYEDVSD